MTMTPLAFLKEAKKSPFYYRHYTVDIHLEDFISGIFSFLNRPEKKRYDSGELSPQDMLALFPDAIPAFQRDNDKWSRAMQESFISNIIQGCKPPPICLYTLDKDGSKTHCKVLDGLQRLTALFRFLIAQDLILKSAVSGQTIESSVLINSAEFERFVMNATLSLQIYHFESELQAVNHYIHVNENISHSTEDIARAKAYRETLLTSCA